MWNIDEDETQGLLTVAVIDPMNDGDVMRAKLALKQRMARLRARRGKAHILFDLTGYAGTSDDVIRQFRQVDGDFVQDPTDRIALVLRRSLDKATARPLLKWPDQSSLFLSPDAARIWLKAN